MLTRNSKGRHLVLFLILGKYIQSFTIRYNISCEFFIEAFYQVEEVPFYPNLLRAFIMKGWVGFCFFFFFFLGILGLSCDPQVFLGHRLLYSCGVQAPEHAGLIAVAYMLSCPTACEILVPQPGSKPMLPALEGKFLTPGPPGKSGKAVGFCQILSSFIVMIHVIFFCPSSY